MTVETKTFDARVIGSITSGVLMIAPFSLVHEAISWIAGHETWTHELPAVSEVITADLLMQFPDLPKSEEEVEAIGWEKYADQLTDKYPDGITIAKGTTQRTRSPIVTAMIRRTTGKDALP